jgi:hypothetical protein
MGNKMPERQQPKYTDTREQEAYLTFTPISAQNENGRLFLSLEDEETIY